MLSRLYCLLGIDLNRDCSLLFYVLVFSVKEEVIRLLKLNGRWTCYFIFSSKNLIRELLISIFNWQECLEVEKGQTFYDFQYNTRLVKSTIVHFQVEAVVLYTRLFNWFHVSSFLANSSHCFSVEFLISLF
jgi:hypothetical protein